jgi:histidine triad (HIT) family protein
LLLSSPLFWRPFFFIREQKNRCPGLLAVVALNDLNPQAPTHVLLVPTLHTENAAGIARNSATMTADLFLAADQIATERGLNGYRTVFNTGEEAGQSVFHAHLHLLGGRAMTWPPG